MIDLRVASLLDFVPDSISDDLDVRAISLAVDPELRDVADAVVASTLLPRIAELDGPVLDAIAWSFRLNELSIWGDASVIGKRRFLAQVFDVLRRAGTPWAIKQAVQLAQLTAEVIEWWQESASPHTYRLRLDASEIGITLSVFLSLPDLLHRFVRATQHLRSLEVVAAIGGVSTPRLGPQTGRLVTIGFGG